jgi:hypothetical protein
MPPQLAKIEAGSSRADKGRVEAVLRRRRHPVPCLLRRLHIDTNLHSHHSFAASPSEQTFILTNELRSTGKRTGDTSANMDHLLCGKRYKTNLIRIPTHFCTTLDHFDVRNFHHCSIDLLCSRL